MKYIVFIDPNEGEHAVLFSPELEHHAVLHAMSECPTHLLKPISAGFVSIGDQVSCWGESGSLKLKSRVDKDKILIESAFRVN